MQNPFETTKYTSSQHFCDREIETKDIISAIKSGRSITMHSIRKIGKTGLIHHISYHLAKQDDSYLPIYLDIYDTTSIGEFINELVSKVINAIDKDNTGFLQRIGKFFGRYRPSLSIDTVTGAPSVQLDIKNEREVKMSLDTLFGFIAEQDKKVVLAIDEFQQVEKYEQKTLPATLRKYLQSIKNLTFIFAGSQRNMLLELFTSPRMALFNSTQLYPLEAIDSNVYRAFISRLFKKGKKKIEDEQVDDILRWTRTHTFYTQYFCNRLFEMDTTEYTQHDLETLKLKIFKENEYTYHSYQNLLTRPQWNLLKAIAKEGEVREPTSKDFIAKYNLGAHSTVRQALKFLEEKELIFSSISENKQKPKYEVYDVFFWRWLEARS